MCGIVGIIQKPEKTMFESDMGFFRNLLIFDAIRGIDGTGAFGVQKNGDVDWLKSVADPFTLFRSDAWKRWNNNPAKYRAIIGHNRKATSGLMDSEGAHPFVAGPIVLVHNGFAEEWKKKQPKAKVDSQAVAMMLADEKSDPKKVIKQLDGAFTLVWYDARDNKLRFIRNDKRPLVITEDAWSFCIASEERILTWAANLANKDAFKKFETVQTEKLFEYDLEKGELKCEDAPFFTKVYQQPTVSSYPRTGHHTSSSNEDHWSGKEQGKSGATLSSAGSIPRTTTLGTPEIGTRIVVHPWKMLRMAGNEGQRMHDWKILADVHGGKTNGPPVKIWLPNATEEHAAELASQDRLVCTISGFIQTGSGDMLISASLPEKVKVFYTYNKIELTATQIARAKHDKKCAVCHKELDLAKYAGWSVRMADNQIHKVKCQECMADFIEKMDDSTRERMFTSQGIHPTYRDRQALKHGN